MERNGINWQHVLTIDNPADLGSRGSLLTRIPEIWLKGPSWLQVKKNWPRQPSIKPSVESEKEVKISKKHKSVVSTTVEIQDDFDLIMYKFELNKALRIPASILRFVKNCRKNKKSGPLTTVELVNQNKNYINREQKKTVSSGRFEDDTKRLNLKKNDEGVYICKGRHQGFYVAYLPQYSALSKKVIFAEQKRSLHGEVVIAMSHVRSSFWIPHLRCLSTSIIRNCYGCKKSRSLPYYSPKPRTLPKDRTEKCFPFEVMVTGSAGPIYHKTKKKSEFKAYVLLFSCSVTRAVEIKLVSNFTTTEFIKGFMRLISRVMQILLMQHLMKVKVKL